MSRNIHFTSLKCLLFLLSSLALFLHSSIPFFHFIRFSAEVHVYLITVSFGCSKHFMLCFFFFLSPVEIAHSCISRFECERVCMKGHPMSSVACLRSDALAFFSSTHRTTAYVIRARQTPSHHRQMELNENHSELVSSNHIRIE